MTTAKAAASLLIELASSEDENDLTNLKLQKLLYFAQIESWQSRKKWLFDDEIEAWEYGPIVTDVYHWLKGCGSYSISCFDVSMDSTGLPPEDIIVLKDIWNHYGRYSANYLLRKTNEAGGPYRLTFDQRTNKVIPRELLKIAVTERMPLW